MIGRRGKKPESPQTIEEPKGFDAYEVTLGDVMRGERATLGKSLLDVQRELKVKATYISAIENADPSAFETPGFVAGYVRSYARYLNLDPEWAFSKFCEEGGFSVVHGLAPEASGQKTAKVATSQVTGHRDLFEQPNTPFVPQVEGLLSRIEPGAVGSMLVLIALIAGIGYGGWAVFNEVQRVDLAPVEQTPGVVADVTPLAPAGAFSAATANVTNLPEDTAQLDRLYRDRPDPLDAPVIVPRDAPIATLNPDDFATFREAAPEAPRAPVVAEAPVAAEPYDPMMAALAEALGEPAPRIQVREQAVPEVVVMAKEPSWMRITSTAGTVLFEGIMDADTAWAMPETENAPVMRVGKPTQVYFLIDGEPYGPAGTGGAPKNVQLAAGDLVNVFSPTDDLTNINIGAIIQDAMARRDDR